MKHLFKMAGLILLAAITAGIAHAAPGDLDVRFGVGGEVVRPYGASTAFTSIGQGGLLLYDRNLLNGGVPAIRARILDMYGHVAAGVVPGGTTWGTGSEAVIPLDSIVPPLATWISATLHLAGSPNGTATGILTLLGSGGTLTRAVRIGVDGRLDTRFNQISPASLIFNATQAAPYAEPPLLQADGSVLIHMGCGFCDMYWVPTAVLELHEDGSLGQRYMVTQPALQSPFNGQVTSRRLADGRVVVVGDTSVLRFNSDGTPDTTFGLGGAINVGNSSLRTTTERALDVNLTTDGLRIADAVVLDDGKMLLAILASVHDGLGGTEEIPLLMRIDPAGQTDASFGDRGYGIASLNWATSPWANFLPITVAMVLQAAPNGRITVMLDTYYIYGSYHRQTVLWRVDGNGHALSGAELPAFQAAPGGPDNFLASNRILSDANSSAVTLMTEKSVLRLSADSPSSPGILDSGGLMAVDEDGLLGTQTLQVPVTRMAGSTGRVLLQYATAAARSGVSATAGEDYIATSGQLEWADGETGTRFIPLQVINDTLTEREEETIQINLTGTSGGAIRAADAILVTIAPSDVTATSPPPPAPSPSPSPSPPAATPNAGAEGGGGRFDIWILMLLGLTAMLRLGRSSAGGKMLARIAQIE